MSSTTNNLGLYKPDLSDTVSTTIPQLSSNFDKIDSSLADIMNFDVKSYGAKGDGTTDDTSAINAAIAAASAVYGVVFFPKGNYVITSTLVINAAIFIVGSGYMQTNITNNGTGDAISFGTTYRARMKDIKVVGNPSSGSGIVIASSYCNLDYVYCENHGQHGFKIATNTWTVNLNGCKAYSNGGSGIYAVANGGSGQVNMINIDECLLHSNTNYGADITGTIVNITNCDIELNPKGGIHISTNTYNVFGINIANNYIEDNYGGCVLFDLYPSKSFYLYNATIENNFLQLNANHATAGAALVKATTDTALAGIASIKIGRNLFYTDTVPHVDLADAVPTLDSQRTFASVETGIIGDSTDPSFFYKNLGGAVLSAYQKTNVIMGWNLAKGISYSAVDKSDNILSTISTTNANYPMLLKTGNQFKKVGVYITTNSTNYTVSFYVQKVNAKTGAVTGITGQTISGNSGNNYVEMSDIQAFTLPKNGKVGANEVYYLLLNFSNSDGTATNFQVGNPLITYYD